MKNFKMIYAAESSIDISGITFSRSFSEDEYCLILVKNGRAKLLLNNTPQKLTDGALLVCRGGDALKYRFSKSYPVNYSIISFSAIEIDNWLSSGVYKCYDKKAAATAFSDVIKEFILKKPYGEITVRALITRLLCVLSRSVKKLSPAEEIIYELALDIHKNFLNGNVDVAAYAQRASLSKDRLSVIFREHFGYAPYKYLLMLKMNEASNLLKYTNLPIGKISEMLGFSSQLYFSSAYKKQVGVSPSDMRKSRTGM